MVYESQKNLSQCVIFEVKALTPFFLLYLHFFLAFFLLKRTLSISKPNNKINLH